MLKRCLLAALALFWLSVAAHAACDLTVDTASPTDQLTGPQLIINIDEELACLDAAIGAGIADGDKGDITVSSSGAVWTIDANAVAIGTDVSGLGTGVATWLGTPSSTNLASAVTGEIGAGPLMFGLAPTMDDALSCSGSQVVRRNAGDTAFECATISGATLGDGDYGDVTVSGSGTAINIDPDAVGEPELDLINGNTASNGDCLVARPSGTGGTLEFTTCPGAGGGISNLVEDLTPQLGGALDTNGFAIEFGSGNTDTTVVRSAAGKISIEGVDVVTISGTQTLTNKSIVATQITAGALNIGNNAATVGTVELANGTANTLSASAGILSIEGVALATAASVTNKSEGFCVAASDETSNLTTGTGKVTFRMPYAFTVTAVRGSLTTAATGASLLTVDINEGGTTIISTKLTFDASETTTTTAATAAVISDSALADDAQMTIDIDQIGNTTAGQGLKVCIIGHQ